VTAALDTGTTAADHPLLEVRNLSVIFRPRGARPVYAVDDVSVTVAAGETVGLVGESGSGKTTLGQAILGLQQPSLGSIFLTGVTSQAPIARSGGI
jgi:peptide/nickel transport system ATP-binding protein